MENDRKYIFDNPENVKRLLHVLYGCCAALVILDFVIHRHVYHSWENLWIFYPIYGFVGCVVLVVIATWMRTFLMRDEDYYQRIESVEAESTEAESTEAENVSLDKEDSSQHQDKKIKPPGEHDVDA